jgi:hypothetical protein
VKYLVVSALLFAAVPAYAESVYKCVDSNGNITFSKNPYCPSQQAYAKNREEPLLEVSPVRLATTSPLEKIEFHYEEISLADLVEIIGDVAGIDIEPVALDNRIISINKPPTPWLQTFNTLAVDYNLDYRQAYGKLYVYQLGSMGETIVHTPDLLRWYQKNDSWDVVLRQDGIILNMRAYHNSTLDERLTSLLRRVREELGEQAHTNAAETVQLQETFSGVGGDIAAGRSARDVRDQQQSARAEKLKRITEKRQSSASQRQSNRSARCFSANASDC